jgi:hypothetical protein
MQRATARVFDAELGTRCDLLEADTRDVIVTRVRCELRQEGHKGCLGCNDLETGSFDNR